MIRRVHIVIALLIFCLSASLTALGAQRRSSAKKTVKSAKAAKSAKSTATVRVNRTKTVRRTRTARVLRKRRHGRRARVRRLVWNPMFPGSRELLVRENLQIDELALPRITDDDELDMRIANEELVPLEDTRFLTVASNLKENRRYCKPWTRDFLEDLSEDFYAQFHRPLMITSLVRTAEQQRKLRRTNRNAAPEEGDTVSTHLTGMTFDLLKRGLTRKQHSWLEQYFLPLKQMGLIEPIEERRQPVFHVTVFNGYSAWADSQDEEDDTAPEVPKTLTGIQSMSEIRSILEPGKTATTPALGAVGAASAVSTN